MKTRRELSRAEAARYRRAKKGKKGQILSEFCALTGYNRSYAGWLLRHCGQRQQLAANLEMVAVHHRKADRRGRPRRYGKPVVRALAGMWAHFGFLCGKRLRPLLAAALPLMHRHGELTLPAAVADKLLAMSPSSIDRLLRPHKTRLQLKGVTHTRSANWLLLQQVPVKTWSEWQQVRGPGHVQMDLVGHDGGNSRGQFAFTLTVTDIWTQWTERKPVANRAQKWVFAALEAIRSLLPFALLSIHTDSGSEFINCNLIRYCQLHHIRLTRGRPARKNDNCRVEQKNYDAVRKLVGYLRYDRQEELALLAQIYQLHSRLLNYLYPSQRLLEKIRRGAKVSKRYDAPASPYQRLLASEGLSEPQKQWLQLEYSQLQPLQLSRQIGRLQDQLIAMASGKGIPAPEARVSGQ